MHKTAPARLKGPRLFPLLTLQLCLAIAMAVSGLVWGTPGAALSALLGGAVAWLPNVFFAWQTFRHRGASQARNIVKSFYRAEAGKFGLTAALFTLVFVAVPPSNPAFFFGAYVVTQLAHWLGPWLLRRPSRT